MSQKALTGLAYLIAVLLGVVVIVGLAQRLLDPTGVAVALCSVLTGLGAGLIVKGRNGPPDGGNGAGGGGGGDGT